ncbi:AsmA family protein [Elizabethkingia anophelis]|uniref:AsmA-like C-terminal region-containing protein n=1 Tax=Elizabethkingia anophelis TaxID=1117645 RepID=UPI003892A1AC
MGRRTIKRILRYVILPLTGLTILFFAAIGIALNFILTPEKLTPQVVKILNENLNAQVRFESIELTFFSSFPHFDIHIKNGELYQLQEYKVGQNDTIAVFSECSASLNMKKLLFQKTVDIKEVTLHQAKVNIFFDKEGKSNLNIIKSDSLETKDGEVSFDIKSVFLRDVEIKQADIGFTDESTLLKADINNLDLHVKAANTSERMLLDFLCKTQNLSFKYNGITYIRRLKTLLQANIQLDKKEKLLSFENSALQLNDIDFILGGKLKRNRKQRSMDVDIHATLKVPSLETIWKSLPQEYIQTKDVEITGTADLGLISKGTYGVGKLPVAIIDLSIEKGAVAYHKFPGKVNLLETNARAYIDFKSDERSYVKVNQLNINATGITGQGSALVKSPLSAPRISAIIKADANFSRINKAFPIPKDIELAGTAMLDLEGSGEWSVIATKNYNSIAVEGDATFHNFRFASLSDTISLNVEEATLNCLRKATDKTRITLGVSKLNADYKNNYRISLQYGKASLARGRYNGVHTPGNATIALSGLSYQSAQKENVYAKYAQASLFLPSVDFNNLSFNAGVSFRDVHLASSMDNIDMEMKNGGLTFMRSGREKLTADLNLTGIRAVYKTDHRIELENVKVGIVKGKRADKQSPLDADLKLSTFKYKSNSGEKIFAENIIATAKVIPGETLMTPTFTTTLTADSLYAALGKNYIRILKGRYNLNLQHKAKTGWLPKGFIEFENIAAYTPKIGIPLQLVQSRVTIANKTISLKNTNVLFGRSDIYVSGYISNLFPAKGEVTFGKLELKGKYIDANELMTAMQKGQKFYDKTFASQQTPVTSLTPLPNNDRALFVLPQNVAFELETSIDKAVFGGLDLQQVQGKMFIKDGHLDLTDFSLKTLAADLYTKMRYEPQGSKKARLLFSMDLHNVEMNKLQQLAPAMDTLFPMAKSFEGKARFSIKGTAALNQDLDININSVSGIAVLKAQDIMVLDSETFRDLSKTFMFKNRKKNTIDNLDMEMLIENSHLEILPALIEIDRYRLAVGGIQNLDLTFDYHISVLKSPVPFKMGVDVKGNLQDYKISLTKARYKYFFTDKDRLKEKADVSIINKKKFIQKIVNF